MNHDHTIDRPRSGIRFRAKWVFILFVAIAAYFLIAEHRAHLSGLLYYWPFLLLLLCPLLHLFMHGGHGGHGNAASHREHGPVKERNPS